MFPFIRLAKDILVARSQSPIGLTGLHVSHHMVWPWDLDMFVELNNGRALTLYDLGRLSMASRNGLFAALKREGWGMTMAGSSVRYRRRLRVFERFEMRSRAVCWDDRFTYIEQSMWKADGACASHVLYRAAITDENGIVASSRILEALGEDAISPTPPDYVAAWIAAEALRPWPPMQDVSGSDLTTAA